MGQFFTAEDIRRLARDEGCRDLVLAPEDRITAEAEDTARRLGVRVHRGSAPARPSTPPAGAPPASGPAVTLVRGDGVRLAPFAEGAAPAGMDVRLVDAITAAHGSPMAAGFMTWKKGSFPWRLDYDEIDFVVEGRLEIHQGGRVVVGDPGDVIYIPRGSEIRFGSPSFARVFYVTFPADWEGQPPPD
jgi:ethanolamine utilization protein EutQ